MHLSKIKTDTVIDPLYYVKVKNEGFRLYNFQYVYGTVVKHEERCYMYIICKKKTISVSQTLQNSSNNRNSDNNILYRVN